MRTLVLNAGFEPLAVVSFKRALVLVMNDSELAAVITYIRSSWGNDAGGITPMQVQSMRGAQAR